MKENFVHLMGFIVLVALLICAYQVVAYSEADGDEDIFTQDYMRQTGYSDQGNLFMLAADWSEDVCYAYFDNMEVYLYTDKGADKLCRLPEVPYSLALGYDKLSLQDLDMLYDTVTYIVAREKKLYGYNVFSGKFGSVDEEGIHWHEKTLDFSCLGQSVGGFPNRIARSFLTDRKLYTFVAESDSFDDTVYAFYGFDLETGKSTAYNIDRAVNVCHEAEDAFLFLRQLEKGYVLSKLDTSSGVLTDLSISMDCFQPSSVLGGLAYASSDESICLVMNDKVFLSMEGGAFSPIAYLPSKSLMHESSGWILPDGRYALWIDGGVRIRAPRSELSQVQIVCKAGVIPGNIESIFKERYPKILLTHVAAPVTTHELTQMISTRDDSIDILELRVDYAYTALAEKGQLADLSSSKVLLDDVASMDRTVQSVLFDQKGHLLAYPTQMRIWRYGINKGFWDLAFADREFPSSMDELLDFWIEWGLNFAEEYPKVEFVESFDYAYWCETLLLTYVRQHDLPGSLPDLTDGVLRNAFKKLEKIYQIRKAAGRSITETNPGDWEGKGAIYAGRVYQAMYIPSPVTMRLSSDYLYGVPKGDFTWLPMTFAQGDPLKADVTLTVFVVNPYSKHLDEAIAFIECASQIESNPYVYYAVHPDINEPYEDPNFEQTIARYIAEKESLEDALEKADEVNRADYEARLAYLTQWIDAQHEKRWMISPQAIADYRSFKQIDLHPNSLYVGSADNPIQVEIRNICKRYANGGFSMEGFFDELMRKMQMLYLESN